MTETTNSPGQASEGTLTGETLGQNTEHITAETDTGLGLTNLQVDADRDSEKKKVKKFKVYEGTPRRRQQDKEKREKIKRIKKKTRKSKPRNSTGNTTPDGSTTVQVTAGKKRKGKIQPNLSPVEKYTPVEKGKGKGKNVKTSGRTKHKRRKGNGR